MKQFLIATIIFLSFMSFQDAPCGIKGDGSNKRMQYNDSLKNRKPIPSTINSTITLGSMLVKGDDTHRFSSSSFVSTSIFKLG